jgi:hypothetical protein
LFGRNRNTTTFCRDGKCCQKARTTDKPRKTKYMIVERKNTLKQKTTEHLKIKNYKFERVEHFKYLGIILHEDNNHQIHLQERIKMLTKHTLRYNIFSTIKTI